MAKKQDISVARKWFKSKGWKPFPFQIETWQSYLDGGQGIVNAPTGSGKTYSLFLPILMEFVRDKAEEVGNKHGIQAIWITPIRALTKEIGLAASRAIEGLGLNWRVGIRSGDTSSQNRKQQLKDPPEFMITTPESLHLMLATKGYPKLFQDLKTIVVDEWHELLGSKRGVQVQLGISRLRGMLPSLKVWGISATIGNMDEAMEVLHGPDYDRSSVKLIRSGIEKEIKVISVVPDSIEELPWAGHLGIKLLEKVTPILLESNSTLIFTNTRSFCETWYQRIIQAEPELSGQIAMHHGSISREIRDWVEQALHEGKLKAVVCTSSLDLGVDFRPVETIIQIGSPKGVARFVQRAGRSGHQPGSLSTIYFVPTNSLELIEAAALREAIGRGEMESRLPYIRSFDVLVQYLITLSASEGFWADEIFEEVKTTFCYHSITREEWAWCLRFISTGGRSLLAYDEFKKVEKVGNHYRIANRWVAQKHKLSMGTIVSDAMIKIKYVSGRNLGQVEESFISQIRPGDTFWFAGRSLELVRIKEMTAQVRRVSAAKGKVPSYMGGRMSFSAELATALRRKLHDTSHGKVEDAEILELGPLLTIQAERSFLPNSDQLLIEYYQSKDGNHLIMYPFESRFVHEGIAALIGYRISKRVPITFSIAMNDYGLELLSDEEIPLDGFKDGSLFTSENLSRDIQASVNSIEMARRKFREIGNIAGLVFKGYPGKQKKDRHLQASTSLFFEVFTDHEPDNLLLLQAYDEVKNFNLEEARLRSALERFQKQEVIIKMPEQVTPFAFPIMVDMWRERLSSEQLAKRIQKMQIG